MLVQSQYQQASWVIPSQVDNSKYMCENPQVALRMLLRSHHSDHIQRLSRLHGPHSFSSV